MVEFTPEQMAEMLALFTRLEADLEDIHCEMREVIAIMDRIIASVGVQAPRGGSIDDLA
jgi:hypothetical protein